MTFAAALLQVLIRVYPVLAFFYCQHGFVLVEILFMVDYDCRFSQAML